MKTICTILLACLLLIPSIAFAASNVTFGWDANSESDLAGYKLYQSASAGGPYTEVADISQASLADPQNPEYTLANVTDGVYFWVITAYDDADNESGYSNEVTADLDTLSPGAPVNIEIRIIIKVTP